MDAEKPILGLIEEVTVIGRDGRKKSVLARIDTGAQSSSIDLQLAQELQLGPIVSTKNIRSSHGRSLRPVVRATIVLSGKEISDEFTLYNRSHMRYKILVGQNILKQGFLIDPVKK